MLDVVRSLLPFVLGLAGDLDWRLLGCCAAWASVAVVLLDLDGQLVGNSEILRNFNIL